MFDPTFIISLTLSPNSIYSLDIFLTGCVYYLKENKTKIARTISDHKTNVTALAWDPQVKHSSFISLSLCLFLCHTCEPNYHVCFTPCTRINLRRSCASNICLYHNPTCLCLCFYLFFVVQGCPDSLHR